MNCTSYIDNVVHPTSTKEVMSELNDQLTYDLQDIDMTLKTMQEEAQILMEEGMLIHQEYVTVARQSDQIEALNDLKDGADKEVFMAAHLFADSA